NAMTAAVNNLNKYGALCKNARSHLWHDPGSRKYYAVGKSAYIYLAQAAAYQAIALKYYTTGDGYWRANNSWEAYTTNETPNCWSGGLVPFFTPPQPSDSFIPVYSQQGWPGVASNRWFQAEGSTSDGGMLGESN